MANIFGRITSVVIIAILIIFASGCSNPTKNENENGLIHYDKSDVYDNVIDGAHIIMLFKEDSRNFIGTITNELSKVLVDVRVEIHLSNGVTLGPLRAETIDPGKTLDIKFYASNYNFSTWAIVVDFG